MTTVQDIYDFIDAIAPYSHQESWDRSGLNCGRFSAPVKRILVALDPFEAVCQEAVEIGANLLLTHHPLLFHPDFVTDATKTGENTMVLLENGVAHLCAHTNFDVAEGGVNDILAECLGLSNVEIINPMGEGYGLLRSGEVSLCALEDFLPRVKSVLKCKALRYVDGGQPVHKVAVGGGACAGELMDAVNAGCDTFVTADVKYNQFWDAKDYGLNLIDAGHFHTENPSMLVLMQKLQRQFPDVEILRSKVHRDCMHFI